MPPAAIAIELRPHDQTPSSAVQSIRVRLSRSTAMLAVNYVLEGDIDRLRVPPPGPRCVTEYLWEHTCCEMFIARQGTAAYHEYNFSPSGDWAVYAFARYRERTSLEDVNAHDPQISVRRGARKLELDALIHLDRLSRAHGSAQLALGLAAVIEDNDGRLSYWALAHAPGRPDFHLRDNFTLILDEVRN